MQERGLVGCPARAGTTLRRRVRHFAAAAWPCQGSFVSLFCEHNRLGLETSFISVCLPAGLILTFSMIIWILAMEAWGSFKPTESNEAVPPPQACTALPPQAGPTS